MRSPLLSVRLLGAALALIVWDPWGVAQVRISENAREADQELNQLYGRLRATLTPSGADTLRNVQRAWVAFQEKDLPLLDIFARLADDEDRRDRYQSEFFDQRVNELNSLGGEVVDVNWQHIEIPSLADADRLLNLRYRSCLEMLPEAQVEAFKETQRLWIQFRDLHCQFDTTLRRGQPSAEMARMMTLGRVVQFQHYIILLIQRNLPNSSEIEETAKEADIDNLIGPNLFRFAK